MLRNLSITSKIRIHLYIKYYFLTFQNDYATEDLHTKKQESNVENQKLEKKESRSYSESKSNFNDRVNGMMGDYSRFNPFDHDLSSNDCCTNFCALLGGFLLFLFLPVLLILGTIFSVLIQCYILPITNAGECPGTENGCCAAVCANVCAFILYLILSIIALPFVLIIAIIPIVLIIILWALLLIPVIIDFIISCFRICCCP